MNFLDRIAVTANYRYHFTDRSGQVEALTDFLNELAAAHIRHVTRDPDVGRDLIRHELADGNWNLAEWVDAHEDHDNILLDAILEAREAGHGDPEILEAINESIKASPEDGNSGDDSYLFWVPLGDEDLPVQGSDGQVNGRQVPDVFNALIVDLTPAEIAQAFKDSDFKVELRDISTALRTGTDFYLPINYGDAGWSAYFKPREFFRALGEAKNTLPLFERELNRRHGGGASEPRETEQPSVPVPHAKEQLLRHLLRYAR